MVSKLKNRQAVTSIHIIGRYGSVKWCRCSCHLDGQIAYHDSQLNEAHNFGPFVLPVHKPRPGVPFVAVIACCIVFGQQPYVVISTNRGACFNSSLIIGLAGVDSL